MQRGHLPTEPPEAIVIGADQAGQPQQRQVLATGGFQFARGTETVKIAIEPDFQEQTRRGGRTAFAGRRHDKAQGGQIQLDDKLARKAGRVIQRHPVLQGGREKEWLSVIRGDGLSHKCLDTQSNKLFNKNRILILRQSRQFRFGLPKAWSPILRSFVSLPRRL